MTVNVSFIVIPGIRPKKATARTPGPLSPTAKYGMDMLENALKDEAGDRG